MNDSHQPDYQCNHTQVRLAGFARPSTRCSTCTQPSPLAVERAAGSSLWLVGELGLPSPATLRSHGSVSGGAWGQDTSESSSPLSHGSSSLTSGTKSSLSSTWSLLRRTRRRASYCMGLSRTRCERCRMNRADKLGAVELPEVAQTRAPRHARQNCVK